MAKRKKKQRIIETKNKNAEKRILGIVILATLLLMIFLYLIYASS